MPFTPSPLLPSAAFLGSVRLCAWTIYMFDPSCSNRPALQGALGPPAHGGLPTHTSGDLGLEPAVNAGHCGYQPWLGSQWLLHELRFGACSTGLPRKWARPATETASALRLQTSVCIRLRNHDRVSGLGGVGFSVFCTVCVCAHSLVPRCCVCAKSFLL